jgi:two-component system CheB/CheR fusion protein
MAAKSKQAKKTSSTGKKGGSRPQAAAEPSSRPNKDRGPCNIVGIGASAGGLEASERFFANMPPNTSMAFILVTHLDPTHASIMPELLQKSTKMKVVQVKDGMKVQPDSLYVIPPNKDLGILNGTLQLIDPLEAPGHRMPIDYFLRSLAEDQKERAICVILSGMGTDGTLGLRAIKGELGMVMVQEPTTAKYTGMPGSAIATGLVDYLLPPEKMPDELIRYVQHANHELAPRIPALEGKTADQFQKIFILLRSHTGHDFSSYKPTTIRRRIERRMNVHQIETLANYVRYLQANPDEIERLFKELLIGVTSFFRDPEAFEVLAKRILPPLLAERPVKDPIRVWIPGCASGEEAYSLAIILRECMDELNRHFDVQVFGTDIDPAAIATARAGVYPGSIALDVSPHRLQRFFVKENEHYRIKKDIRDMLVFAVQNVIKDPPFTKMDLLCCRNLLIYLDSGLQQKLLPLFHYSLKPDGILFLGTSETIGKFMDLFAVVDKKWKVFRCKESTAATQATVAFPAMVPATKEGVSEDKRPAELRMAQMAEKVLLENYVPPSVIINQRGEILYIHGRTGKYLEPAPGEASMNIFEMAREGLKLELPAAIRRVISQKREVNCKGVKIKDDHSSQTVNVTVRPLKEPDAMRGLLVVTFEDMPTSKQVASIKKGRGPAKKPTNIIKQLERELAHTRENLQTTIEELETSNEELRSANEELQSTNEELQSANEEMESSKEELQSLNEELTTVNAELQSKNDELLEIYNDLKNLLNSIQVPTIFLDNELCIKRFTEHATKIFNLIDTDLGRPLGHIVSKLKYERLIQDAQEVLNTLGSREAEVETLNNHWYLMRMLPYRTVDNIIDGVVVTFLDIHEQKMAFERISQLDRSVKDARDFAENIVDTVREPLIVLDQELRVVSANRSFYNTFGVSSDETEGKFVYDLGSGQWDIPRLRELLEEIIPESNSFEDFEIAHEFPLIGHRKIALNARRMAHGTEGRELILLAIQDITQEKLTEKSKQRQ